MVDLKKVQENLLRISFKKKGISQIDVVPTKILKDMKGGISMNPTKQANLKDLADCWPSAFVSRQEVRNFSGGIINQKTMANLDSQGLGPAGRIRIGRKIAYSVLSLIEWLESRATRLN